MEENPPDLEYEIKQLKLLLSPLLSFLQELKDLKRELHISSESSITTISLIASFIRSETLKDISSFQQRVEEKLQNLSENFEEKESQIYEKISGCSRQDEHLECQIKETHDLIVKQAAFTEKIRKDLDYSTREIGEKVGYTEFIKLDRSLKHFAHLTEVNAIKEKIEELAEKSQILVVQKNIEKANEKIDLCLTKTESEKIFKSIKEEIVEGFSSKFLSVSSFREFEGEYLKRSSKNDDEIKALSKKLDMIYEGFKRKISELFEIVNQKPWEHENKYIWEKIEDLATNEKVRVFKEETNERFATVKKTTLDLESKEKNLEQIVSRMDEIMLDKASKDDIQFLTKTLEKYSLSSKIDETSSLINSKIQQIASQVSQNGSFIEALKNNYQSLANKIEKIRKENYEISNISSTLNNVHELIDRKADKSDIFLIYDVMGKKEDISKLSELEDTSRRQVLLAVGIFQAFCRTFLNIGENPAVVQKQRLDAYKSLENLQKWIKEGSLGPSSVLLFGKSNNNLKPELFDENPVKLSSRRARLGSVGTSPRYNKDELPLINL